jgi:hypothetical protein
MQGEMMQGEMMQDRVDTLERISGLEVRFYRRLGTNYFVFGGSKHAIKSVCTYRKAKVFAEGVALGRRLGK